MTIKNKITKVKKRDGRIVDFDQEKIIDVVFKALTATNQGDGKKSKTLSDKILNFLNRRFKKDEIDRKSTRLNSSHTDISRMPSSA